ncbi:ATP-binding protein [Terricaulis sp.]|uniref:ATP-binding protein n=1 Tax=Terricaulis sp. TaxID=2768686 RepID=UPI00378420E8
MSDATAEAPTPEATAPTPAREQEGAFDNFRRLIRRSLAARLLTIALVCVIGLVAVGWIAHAQFNRQMLKLLIDPEISSVLDNLIGNAGPGLEGDIVLQDIPYDPRYQQTASGRYFQIARILDDGGLDVQVISPSLFDTSIRLDPKVQARLTAPDASRTAQYIDVQGPDRSPLRVVARVVELPNVQGRYLFMAGVEPEPILAPAGNLIGLAVAVFVAFCTLMVAAVTVLQIRFGLEPLRQLQRDIANVRRGQAERLTGDYGAELKPVTDELNALVDHNREVVERARRHVGNLAHALKTPIAVLKNATHDGKAEDDVLKQSIEEMEGFVERQLRRARVAARAEARAGAQATTIGYRTPVLQNLNDLVFMMEQKYDHQKPIDISIEAESDVTFRGEREDLLEMAANLIDNACKYCNSQVVVRLLPPFESGGLMEIVVEDDGPGISEADMAKVMARGSRLDEAAPGQGLGLSILKETVELYAGELLFERGNLGGLKARLRLPATD